MACTRTNTSRPPACSRSSSRPTSMASITEVRTMRPPCSYLGIRGRSGGALAAVFGVASVLAGPASAHTGTGLPGGFVAGFTHPLGGFDHLLAMVSVGLWGATLGRPLIYVLPVVFPAMMVVGAIGGMVGVPVPPPEMMVA